MNLKKSILTGIATVGLMASLAAPVAFAQATENGPNSNNATASVVVTSVGTFDVYFETANFDLDPVNLTASTFEAVAAGTLRIMYEDTKPFRDEFDVSVNGTHFANTSTGNPAHTISAYGFTVVHTDNVQQLQWDGGTAAAPTTPPGGDIGDIGYHVDGAYYGPGQNLAGQAWTPGMTDLGHGHTVQFGYAGIGTVGSYGDVDVEVEVPNTTVSGTYVSNLTLTVVSGTAP